MTMKILSINIMHHFYHQKIMQMYLLDQNMIQQNKDFAIVIFLIDLLLNKSKSFGWQVSLLFFVLKEKKLSSHMAQISAHINSSNQKIHSYDQTRKIIVNLSSKKYENNNNCTCQLSRLKNLLLMNIADTPEKD